MQVRIHGYFLEENISFGQEYDEAWYKRVVSAVVSLR